jgi:hypothetical protein
MASLALVSVFVGFLGALTGLGGASILTPMLVFRGIPIKEAIASSMVTIIATSSGSAASYVRERIANVKLAMYLEMYTTLGALAGATVTAVIAPVYLYFLFAAFLLTSLVKFKSAAEKGLARLTRQDRLSSWLELRGSYFDQARQQTIEYRVRNPLWGGLGMFGAGIAAGMLGIGAGAFKVTIHEKVLKIPTKASSATSDFIIGMTALAGVSVYLFSGLLNLTLMTPMALGTTIGAIAGGRILNRMRGRTLRVLFLVVAAFLIAQMLYKGVTSL